MTTTIPAPARIERPADGHGISRRDAFIVWLRIAALSFGGPAGQIAVMHRIVVEEKRWVGDARFLHALNYCMLLPGPEAQQLATYLGWLLHRTWGGVIAGSLFILPGAVVMMGLSWIYAYFGNVAFVGALFWGLKAAVLAIVLHAVVRIAKRALGHRNLVLLAIGAFIAIFFFGVKFPIIVAGAGALGYFGAHRGWFKGGDETHGAGRQGLADIDSALGATLPAHARPTLASTCKVALVWLVLWLTPVVLLVAILGPDNTFAKIATFFSTMAMVTFGGAYAVLAYVAQQAVETYGWITAPEMLDGLGLAETTPGPLVLVLQFVGFLAGFRDGGGLSPLMAGVLGGALATWVTFTPCFLWIFVGAPFVERLREHAGIASALHAITAAVVGVVVNLALWFGIHTLFRETARVQQGPFDFPVPYLPSIDLFATALAVTAIVAIFRLNVGMIPTLIATAGAGLALHSVGLLA